MNKKASEKAKLAGADMNTPEKYSEFESSVLEAAANQAQLMLAEAKRQSEAEFEARMAQHRQDPLVAYRVEAETRLSRATAAQKQENRKKLLVYRQQLVNALFAEAEDALRTFTKTDAYQGYVDKTLARYANAHAQQITVYVRKDDLALLTPHIHAALPGAEITADPTILLGGIKMAAGHILYDETLDCALRNERAQFLGRCGLRVE